PCRTRARADRGSRHRPRVARRSRPGSPYVDATLAGPLSVVGDPVYGPLGEVDMSTGDPRSSAALARGLALQGGASRRALDRQGVALLTTVPLFAELPRRHLRRLAGLAEQVRFGAGRTVVQNGSRGTGFYVIVEGTAKVTVGYSNRAFARLGPGDFFGELALLDGGPRTAS